MYIDAIKNYVPEDKREENDKKVMLAFIDAHKKDVLTRDNKIAHLCASGFILNETLDKTLMIHHNLYNSWGWTGGHADGNPDLLAVALKEACEETGLKHLVPMSQCPQSIDILPVWSHEKLTQPVSAHLHLTLTYLLIADESQPLIIKADENSGVKWIPIAEIARYSTEPAMLPIYEKLIRRAKKLKKTCAGVNIRRESHHAEFETYKKIL